MTAGVDDSTVLAVAACNGHRCRALRELTGGDAAGLVALRRAVGARRDALLVSTTCLGPCARGCVVAVGWADTDEDGRVTWRGRPTGFALAERPERSQALAAWIGGAAPDLRQLPPELLDAAPRRSENTR